MASPIGRIDMHSHLLPGVDDGCPTLEDSIACARAMVDAGYTHACCTPHVWPSFPQNNRKQIPLAVAQLQQEYAAADVPLTLIPGGEHNIRPRHASAHGRSTGHLCDGRSVSADRHVGPTRCRIFFEPAITHLQSFGITVILAHPERMRAVQDDPTLAHHFIDQGLLLQGNLQCFADPPHSATRQTAERLLENEQYHVLGSDTHTIMTLPVRLEGLRQVRRMVGDLAVDELTIHRPRAIVMA